LRAQGHGIHLRQGGPHHRPTRPNPPSRARDQPAREFATSINVGNGPALDPDKDGTVSLDKANAAAMKKFDVLNTDHEGTLSLQKTKSVITRAAFPKADPDKDGTI
jgi:hypothetical protein